LYTPDFIFFKEEGGVTMASRKRVNHYEMSIVEQLHQRYGYPYTEALEILDSYRVVMSIIGGYPMASDWADYFHKAKQDKRTGAEWMKAILKHSKKMATYTQ
jgi:hypothetical protein